MGLSLRKTVTLDWIPKKKEEKHSQWDWISGKQSPWTEFSRRRKRTFTMGLNLRKIVTLDWIPKKKEENSHNGTESLENSHHGLNSQKEGREQSQWDWVSGKQSPWTEFPRRSKRTVTMELSLWKIVTLDWIPKKKKENSHNGTESLENCHPGLNS